MAVSKNKRKNGKKPSNNRARVMAAYSRWQRNRWDNVEQLKRDREIIEADRARIRRSRMQLNTMLDLLDRDELIKGFLRAVGALNSWTGARERIERESFQIVVSSLMLGVMILERIKEIEDADKHLSDLQDACYKCWMLYLSVINGSSIRDEDIAFIHDELFHAQNLMEFAYDHDRQAFIDVLMQNRSDYIDDHLELVDLRQKRALGRHYDRVVELQERDAFRIRKDEKMYKDVSNGNSHIASSNDAGDKNS